MAVRAGQPGVQDSSNIISEKYLNSREATLAVTVTRSPGMTNTCSRHYRRLDIRRRVKAVLGKLSGAALVHR